MGFEGQLSERNVIDALHEVLDGRKSGHLAIRKGGDDYKFHFIFAAITGIEGGSFPRTYREVLARTGKVDLASLESVAERHPAPADFDTELVKLDHFARKELKDLRVEAIKASLWRTFTWRTGEFAFTDVKPPKDLAQTELNLPTADLLLEGIRRLDDASVVEHGLKGRLTTRIKAPQFQRIEAQMRFLKPEEGFILSRIDGTVNLEQVCEISSMPSDTTRKIVFGLLSAGLLEFDEPAPVRRDAMRSFAPAPSSLDDDAPAAGRTDDDEDGVEFDLAGVGLQDEPTARAPVKPPARPAGPLADRKSGAVPRPGGAPLGDRRSGAVPRPGVLDDDGDDGPTVDGMTPRERKAKARESLEAGRKFLEREQWAKAVPFLKEGARLAERDPEAWLQLGSTLARIQGSRKEAEEALMKAIDLNHKNPEPYVELGLLYKGAGNEHKARVQFQNALHWDPANSVARAEMKKEGMTELKENISEALDGVKDQVTRMFGAIKGRKK